MPLNLIVDRTQADVQLVATLRAKLLNGTMTNTDLELWNSATLKGSYNYTDLNRVGEAVQYLTESLQSLGYAVSTIPKINWTEEDVPTSSELQQYLTNVRTLRNTIPTPADLPTTPASLSQLNYIKANNIERILHYIEMWFYRAVEATMYSGDLYAGEI